MAGHSKWANIKHRKGRSDAKKGKVFSRIAKEIISAVKQGKNDPKTNAKLRMVFQKAKAANVPNDVIERNIKKGTSCESENYDEITYEIYGHGGVGILCEAMTDNKNRTASDIRVAINKRGGTIASPGSVTYQFDKKGVLTVLRKGIDEEKIFSVAVEAGAEDVEEDEGMFMITTPSDLLFQVKEALEKDEISCEEPTIEMIPQNLVECDKETKEKNEALIEWLEGIDDIDSVYHNMKVF